MPSPSDGSLFSGGVDKEVMPREGPRPRDFDSPGHSVAATTSSLSSCPAQRRPEGPRASLESAGHGGWSRNCLGTQTGCQSSFRLSSPPLTLFAHFPLFPPSLPGSTQGLAAGAGRDAGVLTL